MAERMTPVRVAPPEAVATPLLVLPWFEGEPVPAWAVEADRRLGGALGRVVEQGDFRGKKDEALLLYPRPGELPAARVLLVGSGRRAEFGPERARRAIGVAVRQAERLGVSELVVALAPWLEAAGPAGAERTAQAAAEAAVLAAWDFRELKTTGDEDRPRAEVRSAALLVDAGHAAATEAGARIGDVVARGANRARQLAARPGNVATPSHLAEIAREIADRFGLGLTVLDREGIRREGMGALLAVSQGSEEEPRFIALEYRPAGAPAEPLVLIGKGVTFDAGGISLKPAEKMDEMKYDMSGAAAVLGAIEAIAELGWPVGVVGLAPATENLPSGRALKPGDVIPTHLGRTVEVVNTDAEGRLILADALSYARRYRPAAVVDAATLTGACVVALGHHAIGLMGNDEALVAEVREAGERAGERCWPLPLWEEYRSQLDSVVADLKNTGGRPAATITAGWFLREFASGFPWAHLDIAGTAWRDEAPPYLRKGPTGVPVRLFVEWVRGRAVR